ncbi:glutamine synthetase [Bacteroides sp. 214]|uniref:glutamine synthetase family protein n=1 Tax=Bacteroides sp. 214 TaxID=2302935 RepID=UPI0013D8CBE5|nr:glutamine synthetase family protein [Bacteroides sp. 214]NDW12988.1 glutamine synthetase [Bacteroides sp. 214]
MSRKQFCTKSDIIKFIDENKIEMVNFMYPAADGRLKTLNFVVTDQLYLESILTNGERVDGSSLFPFIGSGSSDLYVVPRFRTAFIDPCSEIPTLCLLCSYFDKDGNRLESSAEYALHKAAKVFTEETGLVMEAMGELEYYVIESVENTGEIFPVADQRGYHESAPFAKLNEFRMDCMRKIAKAGGMIKYGHSEVGNFTRNGKVYEQNEIEFLPTDLESAADQIVIAKYIIRNLAYSYGLEVSFAPKIITGEAGSGMHVHMRFIKDGKNITMENNELSTTARKAIAGLITLAPSITAFGNTNPTSYFRLVPHQEAPTNICWGDRNRSVLIRVPLGWNMSQCMSSVVNPCAEVEKGDTSMKPTFEMRSPDGSADIYQLLAGLCVACRYGITMSDEEALAIAERTYVDVNIHSAEHKHKLEALQSLPDSCAASAVCLQEQRAVYEQHSVFGASMIDGIIRKLESYRDGNLRQDIKDTPALMTNLVREFFHCG